MHRKLCVLTGVKFNMEFPKSLCLVSSFLSLVSVIYNLDSNLICAPALHAGDRVK